METPSEKILEGVPDATGEDWTEPQEVPLRHAADGGRGEKPLRQRIEEYIERRRLERNLDESLDDEWLR
jgi:hypothetical protein